MIHWVSEAADGLLTPAVKLPFPLQEVKEIIRCFIPYNITAVTEHGTTWADVYLPREETSQDANPSETGLKSPHSHDSRENWKTDGEGGGKGGGWTPMA